MAADRVDLAVIGAGPAGLAAATLAAELGLAVLVLDEQDGPGGQIYRAVEQAEALSPLGADYLAGQGLVAAFRASGAAYRPAATVWHIDPDGIVAFAADGITDAVDARRILVATGAIERPVPIPGWTLPGVMTAGAAQIMLKGADLVPAGRGVLAGQGPLLYLVAAQLARAVRRVGIPIRRGVRRLRALGVGRVEGVAWDGGEMPAEYLFLHEGVIPNTQISLALGLTHDWDEAQLCWRPRLDAWSRTSLSTVSIAGDGGGILGAEAAALSGRLAALAIAGDLGRIDEDERNRRAAPIRVAFGRAAAVRPFLDALYRPAPEVLVPRDDGVTVCRCEEVTAGQIRRAARLGAQGPNQAKAFTRCGMGPCQGRLCGPVVAALIAEVRSVSPAAIDTYRPRAP
jgi:NADPH-dependent 2,4-dienoyl-CoA reductase/sulfur reductase-like enzyme